MSAVDNGGPAFPCEVEPGRIAENAHQVSNTTALQYGMTLRDYFAAKAMAAVLSHKKPACSSPKEFAIFSYAMADAMLAAKSQS